MNTGENVCGKGVDEALLGAKVRPVCACVQEACCVTDCAACCRSRLTVCRLWYY